MGYRVPDTIFLGIETSCDETAVALIQGPHLFGHKLYSQIAEHKPFGGVVPSIAAASHLQVLPTLTRALLEDTALPLADIDAISVTAGPGLVGGLLVGLVFAKGLAISLKKPLWGVHHLEAHALMARMNNSISFPYVLMLLSGGHCMVAVVEGVGQYRILGQTLDDAVGECLDKVARELGEGYPGGPRVEILARQGTPTVELPIPLQRDSGCNFSFSGLKTAAVQWIRHRTQDSPLSWVEKADFCASLQQVIAKTLAQRLHNALKLLEPQYPSCQTCVVSGGVASNLYFRHSLRDVVEAAGKTFVAPAPELCTDNGVMVAWAGYERFRARIPPCMAIEAQPVWSLEALRQAS